MPDFRPKFLGNVGPGVDAQHDSAGSKTLGDGLRRRRLPRTRDQSAAHRAGDFAGRDRRFSRVGLARDHGAFERIQRSWSNAIQARGTIAGFLVPYRGYAVVNRAAADVRAVGRRETLGIACCALTPLDPATFAGVILILAAVALVARSIPAPRNARGSDAIVATRVTQKATADKRR